MKKEGLNISKKIDMASSIYLQDFDELKSQMNAIKQKLNTLEKTRNSEVSSLEDHLGKIQEKIHQLQFEDNFSSSIKYHSN